MKKVLSVMLIALVAMFMLGTISNATTESELKEYMTSEKTIAGVTYTIRDTDKVKLEKFFANNEITDAQATKVKELMEKVINFMTEDGASDPSKLSSVEKKQQVLSYVREAAAELGLTVSWDATESRLDLYKEGTLVDSLYWGVIVTKDGKTAGTTEPQLAKTGASNYAYVVGAGVVLVAGIALVIARKKANA